MIRRSSMIAASVLIALAGTAQAKTVETTLTVNVENLDTTDGIVRVGLFDEEAFKGGPAVQRLRLDVNGPTVTATFENVPEGRYALRLHHDLNDNGKMDRNPFGMPVEPYAFSNNARGQFGPATWEDSSFLITASETEQTVSFPEE